MDYPAEVTALLTAARDGLRALADPVAAPAMQRYMRSEMPCLGVAAPARVREWSASQDRWLRRTTVICQLGSKANTDTALLTDCIEAAIGDPDFFLRKGIGWALRQYARTDPEWVRAFVAAHPGLSPLSRREALKHLAG